MRLTGQIPVSGSGPHGIWYGGNPDDDTAIIMTSNSLDNTVSFIDPAKKEEIMTLPAGLYPLGASVTSDGKKAYAGNCLAGSISIYEIKTNSITKITPAIDGGIAPYLTDRKDPESNDILSAPAIDKHDAVDPNTNLLVGGCPVQTPVSPDDRYVIVPGAPTVVIDTNTDAVVAAFYTGKGAHGATFSEKSDGNGYYAYVTHKKENYVSVIDLPRTGLPSHAGDVPLNVPDVPDVPQNISLFGVSLTGGNGIAANPLPAPWK